MSKQTRRVLFAANTELNARLAACGPDMTLSRTQLRERLKGARAEVDALTARVSVLTAQVASQADEIAGHRKTISALSKAKESDKAEAA